MINDKRSFEDFCYLVTSIIGQHINAHVILAETQNDEKQIIIDGKTSRCKLNIELDQETLMSWYNGHYCGIDLAEGKGDNLYKFFWYYTVQPHICNIIAELTGTEMFVLE